MRVIYEPRGRAREYAPLAVSLYRGCSHGCRYCFVPYSTNIEPEKFVIPKPREDILKKLDRDLAEMMSKGDEREVLMSFTTDPYQPIDEELKLTRGAILLFRKYGRRFSILSKAGLKSTRDFSVMTQYKERCRYGTTLTCWGPEQEYWEPLAASTEDRIGALRIAHSLKIPTWVSMEPLINPGHSLDIIQTCLDYVDEYRLGIMNHEKLPYEIDFKAYLKDALEILNGNGKKYIIKEDLKRMVV